MWKNRQTVDTEPNDDEDRMRHPRDDGGTQEVYEDTEGCQGSSVRNKKPQGGTSDVCDREELGETSSEGKVIIIIIITLYVAPFIHKNAAQSVLQQKKLPPNASHQERHELNKMNIKTRKCT